MKYSLKDKVVLVTGGAKGLGKEISFEAARKGAVVVFCDVDEIESIVTKSEIIKQGWKADFIKCNVADHKQVEAMFAEIMKKYGKIDVLVNNAAIQTIGSIAETSYEDWNKVISVNLSGVFYCMKNAAKEMKAGSVIMNILSIYYNKGRTNKYAYDAAKGGVACLTRDFALELTASRGIIVNSIYPGFVMTPMNGENTEEVYQKGIAKNLIKDTDASTAEGFAEYVIAYIEHFSHGCTGQILGVDAGRGL